MDVLFGPAHFRDVHQTFDALLQLNKCTVISDVGDTAGNTGVDRVSALDTFPWIALKLFHAERDALGLAVKADHLHVDRIADMQDLGRMIDPAPGDIGHVQEAVQAAKINKGTNR